MDLIKFDVTEKMKPKLITSKPCYKVFSGNSPVNTKFANILMITIKIRNE